jgi:REP element-mobilizing transposase RayT
MKDPIAFFITVTTYGTWLPGDGRGWVECYKGWQMPDSIRELEAAAKMNEDAKILSQQQRQIVENQVLETCEHRQWICHAVNCRTNHMHLVIGAFETPPKKVRTDLKAWCTRRLKEDALPANTENWWSERGSIRWVFDAEGLDQVVRYTLDAQDLKPNE